MEIEMEVHAITEDEMPDAQRQATERIKQKFAAGLKTNEVVTNGQKQKSSSIRNNSSRRADGRRPDAHCST